MVFRFFNPDAPDAHDVNDTPAPKAVVSQPPIHHEHLKALRRREVNRKYRLRHKLRKADVEIEPVVRSDQADVWTGTVEELRKKFDLPPVRDIDITRRRYRKTEDADISVYGYYLGGSRVEPVTLPLDVDHALPWSDPSDYRRGYCQYSDEDLEDLHRTLYAFRCNEFFSRDEESQRKRQAERIRNRRARIIHDGGKRAEFLRIDERVQGRRQTKRRAVSRLVNVLQQIANQREDVNIHVLDTHTNQQ